MARYFRSIALLIVSAAVIGCGPNVVNVKALEDFPQPVVEKRPLHLGIHYPKEFAEFTHQENDEALRRGEWTIHLGETQREVFDTVLSSMFSQVSTLEQLPSPDAPPAQDAALIPKVEDFQFALPTDTQLNVIEVWVKYSVALLDRHGQQVGNWQFTAYGRTPTAFLKSRSEALQLASAVAMRDVGASLIIGLEKSPEVRKWLDEFSTDAIEEPKP